MCVRECAGTASASDFEGLLRLSAVELVKLHSLSAWSQNCAPRCARGRWPCLDRRHTFLPGGLMHASNRILGAVTCCSRQVVLGFWIVVGAATMPIAASAAPPGALLTIDQNRAAVVDRIVADRGFALTQSTAGLTSDELRSMLMQLRADQLLAASMAGTPDGVRDVIARSLVGSDPVNPALLQTVSVLEWRRQPHEGPRRRRGRCRLHAGHAVPPGGDARQLCSRLPGQRTLPHGVPVQRQRDPDLHRAGRQWRVPVATAESDWARRRCSCRCSACRPPGVPATSRSCRRARRSARRPPKSSSAASPSIRYRQR